MNVFKNIVDINGFPYKSFNGLLFICLLNLSKFNYNEGKKKSCFSLLFIYEIFTGMCILLHLHDHLIKGYFLYVRKIKYSYIQFDFVKKISISDLKPLHIFSNNPAINIGNIVCFIVHLLDRNARLDAMEYHCTKQSTYFKEDNYVQLENTSVFGFFFFIYTESYISVQWSPSS